MPRRLSLLALLLLALTGAALAGRADAVAPTPVAAAPVACVAPADAAVPDAASEHAETSRFTGAEGAPEVLCGADLVDAPAPATGRSGARRRSHAPTPPDAGRGAPSSPPPEG